MATVALRSGVPPATVVRLRSEKVKAEGFRNPENQTMKGMPLLSLSKPSWIVRTESNVRKERRKKPEPPCVVCNGTGRVDCHHCFGKGRLNHTGAAVLPRGEWPKWCKACGGSGLAFCSRCLGTGEFRYIMGFRFMNRDSDEYGHQLPQ